MMVGSMFAPAAVPPAGAGETLPQGGFRVLCVDDDAGTLDVLRRTLADIFDVVTAEGPFEALDLFEAGERFAVVVSDLEMPLMDGVSLLSAIREAAPATVRVLLTGHADLPSAIAAVNRGSIFRFLTKPCDRDVFRRAVSAAVEQHRLITAERVLLEQTLYGSVKALTDVLALVSPGAFGRAVRIRDLVAPIAGEAPDNGGWQVEIAAMLCQVGSVTLPAATAERLYDGRALTQAEDRMVARLPDVAADLVASIPRLEGVRSILLHHGRRFDGRGTPPGGPRGEDLPWGARLLAVARDFDVLRTQGVEQDAAFETLRQRHGWYDPTLVERFAAEHGLQSDRAVAEVAIRALTPGMVLAEDLRSEAGLLLVARGQQISWRMTQRIQNVSHLLGAKTRVHVYLTAGQRQADAGVAVVG
jgi:response regulator RpfG family c-di-GMP phosphodiesterase